jgi:phosphate transport system protein
MNLDDGRESTTSPTGYPQGPLRTIPTVDTKPRGDSLTDIDVRVLRLFAMVSEGLAAAVEAFLNSDRDAARALVAADRDLDSMEAVVEDLVNRELASFPAPSPANLRLMLAVSRIVPELERSGDLVEHIALRTPQGLANRLSPRARGLISQMGEHGVQMWRTAAVAYANRDPYAAESLRAVDDLLDDLHVSLSAELAECLTSVPAAIEMGLIARFLERLGDHAVNVARRIPDLCTESPGPVAVEGRGTAAAVGGRL